MGGGPGGAWSDQGRPPGLGGRVRLRAETEQDVVRWAAREQRDS